MRGNDALIKKMSHLRTDMAEAHYDFSDRLEYIRSYNRPMQKLALNTIKRCLTKTMGSYFSHWNKFRGWC